MNIRVLSAACVAAAALSGCTAMMWSAGSGGPNIRYRDEVDVAKDNIYAFGLARKTDGELQKGSLVMMGGQYWFVIPPERAEKLLPVLNIDLPNRFTIKPEDSAALRAPSELSALPVNLDKDSMTFESRFCLAYRANNADEKAKLKAIGFEGGDRYFKQCFQTGGTLFAKPVNAREDYRFQSSVPVRIYIEKMKINKGRVAGNTLKVIATPLTIALDTVSVVGLLGDLFMWNFDGGKP
ncbi:hypothetical protein [Neisseria perflava]|uniref:hypothetical protein n=1 Tax=Neisseria perflava TaxID=33053 RepID=UPI0020A11C3A|nr:hypothetical protein [Neisseria perflava]MCP1771334.1 hypothetical protein [Neisseria perflava]